eukprot:5067654-Alexandrium_andersonii.AAC.1
MGRLAARAPPRERRQQPTVRPSWTRRQLLLDRGTDCSPFQRRPSSPCAQALLSPCMRWPSRGGRRGTRPGWP